MNLYGKGSWRFQAFDGCVALWTNSPPNWFHRLTQRLIFGFKWDKPKD